MAEISVVFQIIIALGIVNVWVLRYAKKTPWRGKNASNMKEEFRAYGLPEWFHTFVGATKLTLAALLIVGIWFSPLVGPAAGAIAFLMIGAIVMHLKVGDPLKKSIPAFCMLCLCVMVAFS